MNKLSLPLLLAVILGLTLSSGAVSETQREEIRISYLQPVTVYEKLKEAFPDLAKIVTGINTDKSVLILNAAHPQAGAVREMITKLDQRPTQIFMEAEVAEIANVPSGKSSIRVISKPTITTLEGRPAEIHFTGADGKQYVVMISARVLGGGAK